MKIRKKSRRAKAPIKRVTARMKTTAVAKRRKAPPKSAANARAEASRRTAAGKFNKAVFDQIGGKECRRFAAMTWAERDAFMARPENAAVQKRYIEHLASGGK